MTEYPIAIYVLIASSELQLAIGPHEEASDRQDLICNKRHAVPDSVVVMAARETCCTHSNVTRAGEA